MPPDDRHLLTAAGHGDRTALDALIRRHAPLVLTACRRQLPAADADDAAQAVFLILWRRTAAAAAAPGLPGWLVVTARNVCANARRAAQRRQRAEHAMPLPATPEAPNEARALLDEALASLPAPEREAVIRRHLLGEDPSVVAIALACAEGTVHSRTSRGLERLRTWFARRGIACTTAGLLALCAGECAAAQLTASPTALLQAPSSAAQHLAAGCAPSLFATLGIPLMAILALSCAAIAVLSLAPAAVSPAADVPPDAPTAVMYGLNQLYYGQVRLITPLGHPPPGSDVPPPPADPQAVAALDRARRVSELCSAFARAAGHRATATVVEEEMQDEDLLPLLPGTRDPRELTRLRTTMASAAAPLLPGILKHWMVLVVAEQAGHQQLDAVLRTVDAQRRAQMPARINAAALALDAAIVAAWPRNWQVCDDPMPRLAPPRTTLPTEGGHPFTVIWLPEGHGFAHPLAIATDGGSCLMATSSGIIWQAGTRPAAIALWLRQQLDQGVIHAPLQELDWLEAGRKSIPGSPFADAVKLREDLAALIALTPATGAGF